MKPNVKCKNSNEMEDKIFDIVTDLIRDDISKTEAIDKLLFLHSVVWRSEPCGLLHSTDFNGKCFKCGEQVFVREPK